MSSTTLAAGHSTAVAGLHARRRLSVAAAGHSTAVVAASGHHLLSALSAGAAAALVALSVNRSLGIASGGHATTAATMAARRSVQARGTGLATVSLTPHVRHGRSIAAAGHATAIASIDFIHAGTHLTQLGVEVLSVLFPTEYLVLATYAGASAIAVPIVADACTLSYAIAADMARAKDGTQRAVFFSPPVLGARRVWSVTTDYLNEDDADAVEDLINGNPLIVASGIWIQSGVVVWPSSVTSVSINAPGGTFETLTFTLTEL